MKQPQVSQQNEPEAPRLAPRGRGAAFNPSGRFEPRHLIPDPEALAREPAPYRLPTTIVEEHARSALARNNSPDIPFTFSLNPYRGCEHGCAYCYARPYHEYLGFSAGLDFETKIVVKRNIAHLLEQTLRRPSWKPQPIALSGATDPYQPLERQLQLTRACLEVLLRYRNPVVIVTKNALIRRDLDLLTEMARRELVFVWISVTSLQEEITACLEPRTARPALRLRTIETLSQAGIPVGVLAAPVIPGLTDEELPAILKAATHAGARWAGYTVLRLPGAVRTIFLDALQRHFPNRYNRVIRRLKAIRGPSLNDTAPGRRLHGAGKEAELLAQLFMLSCRRLGLNHTPPVLRTDHFCRPGNQRSLFEQTDGRPSAPYHPDSL
ncbi:PA0069 family radical SAM protein [Rhodothermus profundi]|uniref:DNA repair photolyase n=1 Tax=Rhodothermus profundi TaxID=633813 RepID=A0A1M6VU88_9BACT|nr:PA0069 family radical SAM protein [Rhodothermus profundi]SHK84969.1 DNA repair photolyase [Rhodothermus profundi]